MTVKAAERVSVPGTDLPQGPPRWALLVGALIILSHAVLAWVGRLPGVSYSNDDSVYLLLGQALRSFSYRDLYLLGSPIHTQYPPGWPLILSVFGLFSGDSIPAAMVLVVLLSCAGLTAFFALSIRTLPVGLALIALAAASWSLATLIPAGRLMSEAPYFAASMLVLWAVAAPDSVPTRRLVLAGAAALVAAYIRTVGLSLLITLVVLWSTRRYWKAAGSIALVTALGFGPWLAWTLLGPKRVLGRSYATDLGAQVQGLESTTERLVGLATLAGRRLYQLVGLESPSVLPFLRLRDSPVDNLIWAALAIGLGVTGAVALWRRTRQVPIYLASYFGLLAVWTWTIRRFTFPIQPLLWLLLLSGVWVCWQRYGRVVGVALVGILIVGVPTRGFPAVAELVRTGWHCDRERQYVSESCYTDDQLAFFAAARYARDSLPPGMVMVDREAAFGYHAGHRVVHSRAVMENTSPTPADALNADSVDYVVIAALTTLDRVEVPRYLRGVCRGLEMIRQFNPRTALLAWRRGEVAESAAACSFLDALTVGTGEETGRVVAVGGRNDQI